MMQFTIYGVDQSSLALDSCLMSSGQVDDIDRDGSDARTGKFVLIGRRETDFVRQQGEKLLCLSQCGNDGVKNGDIVVPQWVLSVLCVESFSRVLAKSVSLMLVDPIILSKVVLIYKGRKSYRHWDEVSTKCSFEVPGAWSIDWPVGISKKALEKFLPVLLQSRKLVNDTLIVVDVLDNTMVSLFV